MKAKFWEPKKRSFHSRQSFFLILFLAILEYIPPIQLNSSLIARLDCLQSFAVISEENNYIRPVLNDSRILDITDGRHPVIEKQLPAGESYVPNDTSARY